MHQIGGLQEFAAMVNVSGSVMPRRSLGEDKRRGGLGKRFAQLFDLFPRFGQIRGNAQVILKEPLSLLRARPSPSTRIRSRGERMCSMAHCVRSIARAA